MKKTNTIGYRNVKYNNFTYNIKSNSFTFANASSDTEEKKAPEIKKLIKEETIEK